MKLSLSPMLLSFRTFKSLVLISIIAVLQLQITVNAKETQTFTIAFGSCAKQSNEQVIWQAIAKDTPDLMLMLGDNVYHDTHDPKIIKATYEQLGSNSNFKAFQQRFPIYATWDDHDYGEPDGGKHFKGKQASKKALLDFFNIPKNSELYEPSRGIQDVIYLGENNELQIIMLDTRWYRDTIELSDEPENIRQQKKLGPFSPTVDTKKTMLGKEQWQWLEEQLTRPAKIRIIVSSIQVIPEFTGWEAWANYPHERTKLLNLLAEKPSEKILLLSGDVHRGEFSKLQSTNGATLWEVSSSGLDAKVYPAAPNKHRVGNAVVSLNYGLVNIELTGDKAKVTASLKNEKGKLLQTHQMMN
ncbi:alkaline phosphatase D family protein [Flocculibacter collagenilyticus]|uniref:alkaline phosphatase D family protein n=1 Tax=Flocculibacter collagenilyticus TaxID=2744479 RepID=UPI0018F48DAC|nr:alkaline phosphatase D family protein [Flocculibacter collagenilyticus]